jgi:hypothetical protein
MDEEVMTGNEVITAGGHHHTAGHSHAKIAAVISP